jgi:HEAT repeat protein
LLQAESDSDREVSKAAREARVWLEEIKKVPSLVEALEDADPQVRGDAATQLALLGSGASEAVPALTQALQDPSSVVRANAAWALEKVGVEAMEAVPTLILTLGDEDGWVRTKASDALRAITGQDFGEDAQRWKEWWDSQNGG